MKHTLLLGASTLLACLPLSAQSISINFGSNEGNGAIDTTGGSNSAGAIPISGEFWSNASGEDGSLSDLMDSSGDGTSGSVTWHSRNTWRSASGGATATSQNGALTKGYLDDGKEGPDSPNGPVITMASPYLLNNIYVIVSSGQGDPYTASAVSVNGTFYKGDGAGGTSIASGSGDSWSAPGFVTADSLAEGGSYLKITDQGSVNIASFADSPGRASIAGIQIENAYTGTLSYWDINGDTGGAGGATPSGNWADANWSPSDLGTDSTGNWTGGNAAVFSAGDDATGAYTITLAGTENADAVWVQNGDVTLTGGTLALGATGLLRGDSNLIVDSAITSTDLTTAGNVTLGNAGNSISGTVTIGGTTTLSANQTWNKLAGGGTIETGANTLSVGDATDSSFAGSFTGSGTIDKIGAGSLTLTDTSTTFTGNATLSAGTLVLDTSSGSKNLNWDISGAGNLTKAGGNQLTVLSNVSNSGSLDIQGGTLQVGNVGTVGSIGNPSSITLSNNSLLRYRLSGADATLDSSSVSFASDNAQLRQHAGLAANKLTITDTTLSGTTSDGNGNAVQGIMSSEGGNLVFGSGTTATFRELYLKKGNATIEDGSDLTLRYFNIGSGSNASGIVNQTGGNVTMEAGSAGIRIGHWGGSGREYNLSGGTLDATALAANGGDARYVMMGWDGEGDMTVGGGAGNATLKAAGLKFDRNRGGTGSSASTLTLLNNGVVEAGNLGIIGAGTNDGMVMSGGLLRGTANANWTAQMEAATGTNSTIDLGGGITANQSGMLFGDGDLTKTGAGTLVLTNGGSTHSGGLAVNGGTLHIGGTTASAVTLASGATLQGGTPGSAGTGTIGALTLDDGSLSTFRIGGTTNDQINITDTDGFTVTSGATHTATIVPAGSLAVGNEFTLFDYVGTIQGDGVSGIAASIANPHYALSVSDDVANTLVKLTIDSVDSVIWTGSGGSIWDEENTTSWKRESDSGASDFYTFDKVKFDDTSPAGTVTLSGTINPATVEFNSSNNHTLSGGGISGSGGLTKAGTGITTLNNSNSYTGLTDVQSGTLQIGNGGTTGEFVGGGDINVAAGAQVVFNRSDASSLARTTSGDGLLVKDGSGNLTITAGNNAVDMTINDGTLLAHGGGWATGFANGKTITVNAGGTLDTVVHSLGGLGAGGILPGNINLNGGTWQLNNEQYTPSLTMTEGLTTGPGEIRTTGGAVYTINAAANSSVMAARLNMVGNKTIAVANGAAATDLLISGQVIGGASLTKTGAGRMVLSGTNTWSGKAFISEGRLAMMGDNSGRTGGYEVTGGTLEVDALTDAAIGTGFIALKNGTLEYNGAGTETTTRTLWIDGDGQSGTFDVTDAAANLTINPGAGNVNQETIKAGAGTLTMQGVISGGGVVTVNSGTMILDAVHTYTGDTTITAGTLKLAAGASIANSGNIIVGASTTFDVSATPGFTIGTGQTLTGTGMVAGNLIVDGIVGPGFSPGTLEIDGNMTITAGAIFDVEIAGILASQYDRLDITGDLTIDGTVALNLLGYNPILGDSFDLADWTGTATGTPLFDFTNATLDPGIAWNTDNFLTDGTVWVVVPEPSVLLLSSLASLGLLVRRRD